MTMPSDPQSGVVLLPGDCVEQMKCLEDESYLKIAKERIEKDCQPC